MAIELGNPGPCVARTGNLDDADEQTASWVWRGHVHAIGNHQAKAVEDMRHALELERDHFEARLYLAKPAEAEVWLSRALTEAPQDAKIHLALASCLRMNGKEAEAQQHEDFLRQPEAGMRRARDEKLKASPPVPGQ